MVFKLTHKIKCEKFEKGIKIIYQENGNSEKIELFLPNKTIKYLHKISEW